MNRSLPQRLARQFGAGALALAAAWAAAAAPASTAASKHPVPFDATVTKVVDGDSLWLLTRSRNARPATGTAKRTMDFILRPLPKVP